MKLFKCLVLFMLVNGTSLLNAVEYYVATDGDDSAGTGVISSPWRTVKYAIGQLAAGDTLYIRGGLYRESYIDTFTSGTGESSRITITGYKNEQAIISSMLDASGTGNWTQVSGDIYKYNNTATTTYRNISVDSKPLRLKVKYNDFAGASTDVTAGGEWSRDRYGDGLWVWVAGGGNPGAQNIEISYAYQTIRIDKTISYITLKNLTIEGGYYPLDISGDYINVENCTIRNSYGDTIKVSGWTELMSPPEWNSEYGKIENCDIYYFGESAIDITGGDYWKIKNSMIHNGVYTRYDGTNNGQKLNGIMLKNNNIGTEVDGCRIFNFDAAFGAIALGGSSDGATRYEGVDLVAKNNIIHDINAPYITTFTGAKDCSFVNNIIYSCDTSDSVLLGNTNVDALIQMRNDYQSTLHSTGVTILNNIFHDNNVLYNYRETIDGSDTNALIDNNYIYSRDSYFDGAAITFSSMQSSKSFDVNSLTSTPGFVNYSNQLLRLIASDSGIEAGTELANNANDYNGAQRVLNSTISIGAFESMSSTIYCDGTSVANWGNLPANETITSVYDSELDSNVIQTTGTSASSYTLFVNSSNGLWYNDKESVITFKAKFSTGHAFQVRFKSIDGTMKSVKFYSNYTTAGPHTSTLYRFPLGTGSASTEDGQWHTYVFDLSAMIAQVDSNDAIDYIERFYVWGGGKTDDIELHNSISTAGKPKGLIGEWKLNEGAGSYTEDTSDKGRHGILNNLSDSDPLNNCWVPGQNLKALSFDKSAEKSITVPAISESFTKGFTADIVARFDNLDSSYDVLLSGIQGNGAYGRVFQQYGFIYMQVKVDGGTLFYVRTLANKLTVGDWHRITVRCDMDAGTLRIFVDGVDATDLTRYYPSFTATALDVGTADLYLGNSPTNGHAHQGEIDAVRLYNHPLSDSEILNLDQ
ncbi:MAG: hypothetical protein L3J71_17175 [Victivallaceae bacterium]|nr:hypothetical protein [Victivallaceae bacterium]